jgi:selenoprotein W-related protein
LKQFEPEIEELTLIPSDNGKFEVVVNGQKLYSKLATGRHANPGEVVDLVRKQLRKGTA